MAPPPEVRVIDRDGASLVPRRGAAAAHVSPDVRVAAIAGEQWGIVDVAELTGCGLSAREIAGRVRAGRLHPLHRGVYAVGHSNPSIEGTFLAATKAAGPDAVLSHFAAAALLGLVEWDDRRIDVTVPRQGTRRHRGLRLHRTKVLEASDVRRRHRIPVTSPGRTLVDLAGSVPDWQLRRAVRQAQSLKLVSLPHLASVLVRLGSRRGVRNLRSLIATGPAPTRSELEDAVLDLIDRGGLARPDVNEPITLGGRRVVPDFRWPHQRLVIEADGAAWHDHRLAREADAGRQALLEAHGERVVRVTWEQAVRRPVQTLDRMREAGAPTR